MKYTLTGSSPTCGSQEADDVALGRLELHHVGPEVGEHAAADRPRHHLGEVEHPDPGEGPGERRISVRVHGSPHHAIARTISRAGGPGSGGRVDPSASFGVTCGRCDAGYVYISIPISGSAAAGAGPPRRGGNMHARRHPVRMLAAALALAAVATAGLVSGAGAQTADAPGVTAKAIKLGYISSQTGVAAVDAQERPQGVPGARRRRERQGRRQRPQDRRSRSSTTSRRARTSPPRRTWCRTARCSRWSTTRRSRSSPGATSRTRACR